MRRDHLAALLDPGYALAWSGLALTRAASAINGDAPPESVGPLGRAAADRAVAADPDLVEAQTALGYVRFLLDWKWEQSETALRRAIGLDPRHAAAHRTLAHLLSQTGRHGEAKTAMQRALDLEPLATSTCCSCRRIRSGINTGPTNVSPTCSRGVDSFKRVRRRRPDACPPLFVPEQQHCPG